MSTERLMVQAFAPDEAPARRLAAALQAPLATVDLHVFPDGEILPRAPVGAETTIVYASLDRPNEKLIALLLAADAWRRDATIHRLILAAPYLAYLRQDQAFRSGEPVSQAVVCGLLADRFDAIITVDPHLHRVADLNEAYPATNWRVIDGLGVAAAALAGEEVDARLIVVGPDVESTPLAARFAARLGRPWFVFSKQRLGDHRVELTPPAGAVMRGASVLIVDDICSSGGTMTQLAFQLRKMGAASVEAIVTHALFDHRGAAALKEAGLDRLRSCDSCPHPSNAFALDAALAGAVREIIANAC
ncbi:MAG: ribose-phosphate diphosphokinase [Caulobacterales bacterium]